MKQSVLLIIASLLSILFMTFHMTADFVHDPREMSQGAFLAVVVILVVWLYGTLVLVERPAGYVILILGSLAAAGMPVLHTMGAGIAPSRGAFFVWTLLALGVTGVFSLVLSIHGLWRRPWRQPA
jgi:hypothetical protein